RERIKGARITGMLLYKIELLIKYSYGTIRDIFALETLYTNSSSMPRKGRPLLYSNRDH
ncbi:uncharacterized protein K444DRAFT_546273, partial [Hyaloscypha bicolor E]